MNIALTMNFAPGDAWALTGLLRDFADQRPGDRLFLRTPYPEIFLGNPFFHAFPVFSPVFPGPDGVQLQFRFGEEGNERYRYGNSREKAVMVGAFYEFLNRELGFALKRNFRAVDFYPDEVEKAYSLVPTDLPVCIVNAGFKDDNPAKWWGLEKFQAVADHFAGRIRFIQVGGVRLGQDFHRPLKGAEDWRGRTTLRELAQLVYHADFVLTGVSQLHHISAIPAYKARHCITVAGAREPRNWADCYERENVTWHWISNNADFAGCMEKDDSFHDLPGCWRGKCDALPARCMRAIPAERIIGIMEENL